MTQKLAWPVDLQRQEDGAFLVSFPDIPEALTEGRLKPTRSRKPGTA